MRQQIEGNIVDLEHREIFAGTVVWEGGRIVEIKKCPTNNKEYIIPGFVDAHVHVESSMLSPTRFGQLVIGCGTIAIVTDPHEIANVMGTRGIDFMMDDSKDSPVKTFFSIPSCVPSTPFDVSGGIVSAADVEKLAASGRFVALSEMMNVPGVLYKDKEVMAKLAIARKYGLPIDGHSPRLSGKDLDEYISCGICTDHECLAYDEAKEKVEKGMKLLIREGSAARNYQALKQLIKEYPNEAMFCTDDAHPDDILDRGHIDKLVRMAIADHFDLFDVLRIASVNAIDHYKLDVGHLRVGDKADFIVVDSLTSFNTQMAFIDGVERFNNRKDKSFVPTIVDKVIDLNNFNHDKIQLSELKKSVDKPTLAIEIVENELVTKPYTYVPAVPIENLESDTSQDIVKIVYLNRYVNGKPQIAFCRGTHLSKGAFASSVAHDTHNIIAVGCDDESLLQVINTIIEHKGGLAVHDGDETYILPLPVGGIISDQTGIRVANKYDKLNELISQMGCRLSAPFMTLSFMSLVVIPEIKIGEKGLFSYSKFNWIEEQ